MTGFVIRYTATLVFVLSSMCIVCDIGRVATQRNGGEAGVIRIHERCACTSHVLTRWVHCMARFGCLIYIYIYICVFLCVWYAWSIAACDGKACPCGCAVLTYVVLSCSIDAWDAVMKRFHETHETMPWATLLQWCWRVLTIKSVVCGYKVGMQPITTDRAFKCDLGAVCYLTRAHA